MRFFDQPILNSPYESPSQHWELDEHGQPTNRSMPERRSVAFITPIPQPRKHGQTQREIVFDQASQKIGTDSQQYNLAHVVNDLRRRVDSWRRLPNPNQWRVTPETARLLQHWRHHRFSNVRPFFCQVEAVETVICLTEVAPKLGREGRRFLDHLNAANEQANPGLNRLALKLATGAGKTTVMAMLIAWQTINTARSHGSQKFTCGFLIITPGLTIRDRRSGPETERPGQLLRRPRTRARRRARQPGPRKDHHHQLPRLHETGNVDYLERRPFAPPGARTRDSDVGERGTDAPTGHARVDGHEERHGLQR